MDEDKLRRRKRGRRLENVEAYKDGWIAASNGREVIIFLPLNESRGASRVISNHFIEFGCLKWETLSSSERSWRSRKRERRVDAAPLWRVIFLSAGDGGPLQGHTISPLCLSFPSSLARLPHLFYRESPNLSFLHQFAPCRCLDQPKTDLKNSVQNDKVFSPIFLLRHLLLFKVLTLLCV